MNIKLDIKIQPEIIRNIIVGEELSLPKYVAPLINLANQFAQATRPRIVGQLSELIKECPYKDFKGWKEWYLNRYPNAIEEATDKIMNMLENFKEALEKVDRNIVKKWVEDLVIIKTFIGLKVQEPILVYLSRKLGEGYRLAIPEEESKGIDGYIGEYSISIKPITFKEKIGIAEIRPSGDIVIYYKKDKDNNIVISEIEGLTEKGKEFVERIRRLFKTTLDNFFS